MTPRPFDVSDIHETGIAMRLVCITHCRAGVLKWTSNAGTSLAGLLKAIESGIS